MSLHTDPLWKALWMDTASLVFVAEPSGSILETNGRYVEFGLTHEPKHLSDLSTSEGFATEHLALIAQATQHEGPITIRGYFCGRFSRVTYRRLNDGARVLAVVTLEVDSPVSQKPDQDANTDAAGRIVRSRHDDLGQIESLTNREVQVLRLIGMGFSTAQIAENLDRSVKTVEWHRVSLGNKLSVSNRVELARIAIRSGLCGVSA